MPSVSRTDTLQHLNSPAMRTVYAKIKSVADTRTTVLFLGETGTGKGVAAKLLHELSQRRSGPFVNFHCSTVPDTLLDSELFGHERGAFTGAYKQHIGKFELARNGTLFLDEIGTISLTNQLKLLKVLQERTIQRVGGEKEIGVEVRVVSATNKDLEELCAQGAFRWDLYYRLNVFPILLPPLRERTDDILPLAEYFLGRFNTLYGKGIEGLQPEAASALITYHWPGNIRELENIIERAYLIEQSPRIAPASLPVELFNRKQPSLAFLTVDIKQPLAAVRAAAVQQAEFNYLKSLLRVHKGRIDRSAQQAGISVRQLNNLMHKYHLDKEAFKSI